MQLMAIKTHRVQIGNYTYISTGSTADYYAIGLDCSISSGVKHCLIFANAIVLSGSHLNQGPVVTVETVVTHDVRPYEIVGEVPAKHIGWRFDEQTLLIIV